MHQFLVMHWGILWRVSVLSTDIFSLSLHSLFRVWGVITNPGNTNQKHKEKLKEKGKIKLAKRGK